MKTWELIKLLQEEDPNNICDVTVGNQPISWIERLPYYYDGRLQAVCRVQGKPVWVGYPRNQKIKIHIDSIEDALFDNPDAWIDTSGIEYNGKIDEWYAAALDKMIAEAKEFAAWRKEMDFADKHKLPPPPHQQEPPLSWRKWLGNSLKKLKIIE